jgi:hypothetical protein
MHFAQAQSYRFGILLALYAVDDDCIGKILARNKADSPATPFTLCPLKKRLDLLWIRVSS